MKSLHYISSMIVLSMIIGLIYISIQQAYRSGANDPQVQVAYDIKYRLEKGKQPDRLLPDTTDLESSLGLFAELFDAEGKPVLSTGLLHGKPPLMPEGVLNFVKDRREDRVTWQPEKKIRMAMVILRTSANPIAFIAVGRSLRETEVRESFLSRMTIVCWIISMTIILATWLFQYYIFNKK